MIGMLRRLCGLLRRREGVVPRGYRGINVVCDEAAGDVPEPGGLPGAEPTHCDEPTHCRWWRHQWTWWGLGGHTRTCMVCGKTVRETDSGAVPRPDIDVHAVPKPPPKPRGSRFVNTAPDGRGGGVWVDVNAPPIEVSSMEDSPFPQPGVVSMYPLDADQRRATRRVIVEGDAAAERSRRRRDVAAELDALGESELAWMVRSRL